MDVMAVKRTTISLDDELVARAKRALGCRTIRETVEKALEQAAERAEAERARLDRIEGVGTDDSPERRQRQMELLRNLDKHLDVDVYRSDDMWRRG